MKYVFGPVNSRRLGVSLGIDIVPFKVCSFNCVYCECGATTELTDEVREYLPYDDIISEISRVLEKKPRIDVITFSGSGEPTLNSRIGDVINFIKVTFPGYRVAVITNSSTLYKREVRESLLQADIIYPSLDAVSKHIFDRIIRPLSGTDPETIIDSIRLLRDEFKGRLCLEIFIIEGLNDTDDELCKLREACISIRPDEIHLNSLDRPGTEEWVKSSGSENMDRVKKYFEPLPVKIIGHLVNSGRTSHYFEQYEKCVFDAIATEGSTAEMLSEILALRLFDILRALKNLSKKGSIEKLSGRDGVIYRRLPE